MTQQTTAPQVAEPTLTDLVDHLTRFDGPPDQFLLHLLAVQCHIGSARGGSILRTRGNQETEVLAVYPAPQENQTAPVWLAQSVEAAPGVTKSTETVVAPIQSPGDFYDESPVQHLIMIPLRSAEGVRGVAAFLVLGLSDGTMVNGRFTLLFGMLFGCVAVVARVIERRQSSASSVST